MRPLEDADVCNTKQQQSDETSVLAFWIRILKVRKEWNDLLVHGEYDDLDIEHPDFFCFSKTWKGKKAVAICNFIDKVQKLEFSAAIRDSKKELLVSSVDHETEGELKEWEANIFDCVRVI
jgi:oligo-1,6-glucosidase